MSASTPEAKMEVWRLLPFDLGPSEHHFALSEALVRRSLAPTVWWHSTDAPTLLLGPGQKGLDVSAALRAGVAVVRRQAGGTAVYAGPGVLGQDVFLPAGHSMVSCDVVETYRWLGETWQDALRSLGVPSRLVSVAEARARHPPPADVAMACFGSFSPYEVAVDGRKLVGLAQVRRANGTLLQAGIHLRFEPETLAGLLPGSRKDHLARRLRASAIGLQEVLPAHARLDDVMIAVNRSIESHARVRLSEGTWTAKELDPAADPGMGD